MSKRGKAYSYKKFDVIYVDFEKKIPGVQKGANVGVIVSCDASNNASAARVTVVPLVNTSRNTPVHVRIMPCDIEGYSLGTVLEFVPEYIQPVRKSSVKRKIGYITKKRNVRDQIDRALIREFELLPIIKKILEENEDE